MGAASFGLPYEEYKHILCALITLQYTTSNTTLRESTILRVHYSTNPTIQVLCCISHHITYCSTTLQYYTYSTILYHMRPRQAFFHSTRTILTIYILPYLFSQYCNPPSLTNTATFTLHCIYITALVPTLSCSRHIGVRLTVPYTAL